MVIASLGKGYAYRICNNGIIFNNQDIHKKRSFVSWRAYLFFLQQQIRKNQALLMNCSGFIKMFWKIQAERQSTYAWLRKEISVRHSPKCPEMCWNIGKKPIIPEYTIWGWKQAKIKVTPCHNNRGTVRHLSGTIRFWTGQARFLKGCT